MVLGGRHSIQVKCITKLIKNSPGLMFSIFAHEVGTSYMGFSLSGVTESSVFFWSFSTGPVRYIK